jgi:YbbR domain-containing protein
MKDPREFVGVRPTPLFFKHVLRKIFLEDWLLKLTALLITFALWYGVSVSSKKGTATLDAQLSFRVSDDTVLTNASRQEVRISVAGNDRLIGDLYGRNDLRVTADLTQTDPGDRILQLTPQSVSTNLPSGIKLEDIQPSRIAVTLETLVQKDLPVEAAISGEPAGGYEVYSATVAPARTRVSGPESFMDTLYSVPTGAVDISGAKSDVIARQVAISINNARVTLSNTVVDVTVSIGEKRVERMFAFTASGKRVTATLYGPRSVISKLKAADMKVDIVKGDSGNDLPQLTLPDSARSLVEIHNLKLH